MWISVYILTSINRNILECKVVRFRDNSCYHIVLIETYWNVKEKQHRKEHCRRTSINRNILECKG